MDPVSIFALVTASFNGIKKAVEMGREVEDVYSQLSKWAGAVSDLRECIHQHENRKPSIFEKIGFSKNETAEAFDMMVAKQKLYQMEREIHLMFIYGELQHLGIEGYKEFVRLRKEIKEKREELIYDQMRRRKIFVEKFRDYTIVSISLIFCSFIVIWILQLMLFTGTE